MLIHTLSIDNAPIVVKICNLSMSVAINGYSVIVGLKYLFTCHNFDKDFKPKARKQLCGGIFSCHKH